MKVLKKVVNSYERQIYRKFVIIFYNMNIILELLCPSLLFLTLHGMIKNENNALPSGLASVWQIFITCRGVLSSSETLRSGNHHHPISNGRLCRTLSTPSNHKIWSALSIDITLYYPFKIYLLHATNHVVYTLESFSRVMEPNGIAKWVQASSSPDLVHPRRIYFKSTWFSITWKNSKSCFTTVIVKSLTSD